MWNTSMETDLGYSSPHLPHTCCSVQAQFPFLDQKHYVYHGKIQ